MSKFNTKTFKKILVLNFTFILINLLLIDRLKASDALKAGTTQYEFTRKVDSEGISCTIDIVAISSDVTNGFEVEFGYLYNKQNKTVRSIMYWSWKDNYLANGKLIKSQNKNIKAAVITDEKYNSYQKFEKSAYQANGEYWQFSSNLNEIISVVKITLNGQYEMRYVDFNDKITSIEINKAIDKEDITKFVKCYSEFIK